MGTEWWKVQQKHIQVVFKVKLCYKMSIFHWGIHARKFAVNTNLNFCDKSFFRLPLALSIVAGLFDDFF